MQYRSVAIKNQVPAHLEVGFEQDAALGDVERYVFFLQLDLGAKRRQRRATAPGMSQAR